MSAVKPKAIVLPASLSSAEDLRQTIDEIRELARQSGPLSPSSLSPVLHDLYAAGYLGDSSSLRDLVTTFERIAQDAPRIGITLAGPVDAHSKQLLTEWFRTNYSPIAIVSFGFNRSLLGGILVRAGSHIYDWSYRSRLLDTKVNFSEVLANVR